MTMDLYLGRVPAHCIFPLSGAEFSIRIEELKDIALLHPLFTGDAVPNTVQIPIFIRHDGGLEKYDFIFRHQRKAELLSLSDRQRPAALSDRQRPLGGRSLPGIFVSSFPRALIEQPPI